MINLVSGLHSLNPLLDSQEDTLENGVFKKLFTGKEFYIADHRVNNIPTLPGVAYLEMVRAAESFINPKSAIISISNVIWASPIQILDEEKGITVSLHSGKQASSFEVTSGNDQTKPDLHARGKIIRDFPGALPYPSPLDIAALKNRCLKIHKREDIYRHFYKVGLQYGPNFQMINELSNNNTEVLSVIQLPQTLSYSANDFCLHPNILDGAIQTVFILMADLTESQTLYLPYSIGRIDIYKTLPSTCIVHGTITLDPQMNTVPKFQIYVANTKGEVAVRIQNFTARAVKDT